MATHGFIDAEDIILSQCIGWKDHKHRDLRLVYVVSGIILQTKSVLLCTPLIRILLRTILANSWGATYEMLNDHI